MKKKNDEQKALFKNLLFICCGMLVVIAILYMVGALDDEKREVGYKTDSVCMMSGHLDGTDQLVPKGTNVQGRVYWFNCSDDTTKVSYDANLNSGYIIKVK
jgi:hypothetical protein